MARLRLPMTQRLLTLKRMTQTRVAQAMVTWHSAKGAQGYQGQSLMRCFVSCIARDIEGDDHREGRGQYQEG
jgi:hypothetical protein